MLVVLILRVQTFCYDKTNDYMYICGSKETILQVAESESQHDHQ